MPTIRRKTAAPTATKPAPRAAIRREEPREEVREEVRRDEPRQQEEKSEFVTLTKLFESKKNPDNLVGTCRNKDGGKQSLDDLAALVAEAQETGTGVTFFAFLQGQWGPSLSACLGRPEENRGSFNDGNRGGNGYSRQRYGGR